jgi:DNA-binding LytR/AlgR family response regulator
MMKILLIEDDKNIRSNIKYVLEASNYKVFSAEDGKEGIQLAKEVIPDLVICDILMPVLDGYQVKNELSADPKTASIPFIFLSAKSKKCDVRAGMNLGADDYLTKPFKTEDLLNAVEVRLSRTAELSTVRKGKAFRGENTTAELERDDTIFVEIDGKPIFIKISDIIYIAAKNEYSNLYLRDGRKLLVRRLIKQWDELLPKKVFLRIHRSTIINLNSIKKIERWFKRSFIIYLENSCGPVYMSERFARKLKSQLQY